MQFLQVKQTVSVACILACVIASVLGNMDPDKEDFIMDSVKWGLTNSNNTDTCIILNGIFQVLIPYETTTNTMTDTTLLSVPRNASISGYCGDLIQNITLSWLPASGIEADDPPTHSHTLTLTFVRKGQLVEYSNDTFSEPYYELQAASGTFYAGEAEFPKFDHKKSIFTLQAMSLGMLSAPVGLSFFCQATEAIESETHDSTLLLSLVQAQAYHVGLTNLEPYESDFGPRSYCPADGYKMIFTVFGFVFLLSIIGALVFLIVNWFQPKRRIGYWNL